MRRLTVRLPCGFRITVELGRDRKQRPAPVPTGECFEVQDPAWPGRSAASLPPASWDDEPDVKRIVGYHYELKPSDTFDTSPDTPIPGSGFEVRGPAWLPPSKAPEMWGDRIVGYEVELRPSNDFTRRARSDPEDEQGSP